MKKFILKMSVSIDGFVGGPNGESEWIFRTHGNDATKWDLEKLRNVSLHLMGSRTYQDMAAWWPTSKEEYMRYENPHYMAEEAGAADFIAGSRLQLGVDDSPMTASGSVK